MQRILLATAFTAAVLGMGVSATAQSPSQHTTTVCLRMDGSLSAPVCRSQSAWHKDDICQCGGTAEQVMAPVCRAGEQPVPQGGANDTARRHAVHNGSLVGATYNGRRFCVRADRSPYN
jgi:hypothetical protein